MEKQEWVTDVSSSEESSDEEEDIVTIALTNEEPPLPPPPMCLMANGNTKVCEVDSEDDRDEELDPYELAHKNQELKFAYEAIDPSLENFVNETIEKVNASTSCDDLLNDAHCKDHRGVRP